MLHQKSPHELRPAPCIQTDGKQLNNVEHFTYLGSVMSCEASIDKDVDSRIAKASAAFGRLQKRVFKNHSLSIPTKIAVYNAIVVSTLLYGSESWVLYRKHIRLLERFHQRCLRAIMRIDWKDHITNNSVSEQASVTSIEAMPLTKQMSWSGHVSRMKDDRMPKAVFYGELVQG